MSNLKFRTIILISSSVFALRKQRQITYLKFKIRHVQTDELPRTLDLLTTQMPAIERTMRKKLAAPFNFISTDMSALVLVFQNFGIWNIFHRFLKASTLEEIKTIIIYPKSKR